MLEPTFSLAGQSLADSAETMAFVSLIPAENSSVLPADAVQISIPFTGPVCGTLDLAAPAALGALLAANMLGCEPSHSEAQSRADDALKELMNVTCGNLLPKLISGLPRGFEMGLPRVAPLDNRPDWETHFAAEPGNMFDAEGIVIGIRLKRARQ